MFRWFSVFRWFSASLGQLPGPLGPFLPTFGEFWIIVAPRWPFLWSVLPVSGHLCPCQWVSGPCKRHKIDVYALTIHLIWDPGHTQAPGSFSFLSSLVPLACSLLLATVWRPTWRGITINKPIRASSVILTRSRTTGNCVFGVFGLGPGFLQVPKAVLGQNGPKRHETAVSDRKLSRPRASCGQPSWIAWFHFPPFSGPLVLWGPPGALRG